jgi:hypothetical protein
MFDHEKELNMHFSDISKQRTQFRVLHLAQGCNKILKIFHNTDGTMTR